MTGETIKCGKCGDIVPGMLCDCDDRYGECINCFGMGFLFECQKCSWMWTGEESAVVKQEDIPINLKAEKAKMTAKIYSPVAGTFYFLCPGCSEPHAFNSTWEYNNDAFNPTVQPSLLVTGGAVGRCHSFIASGEIRFLDDCSHSLARRTVALEAWDERLN